MKIYIKAAAMKQGEIGSRLDRKTSAVMRALAQLYIFPDNVNKYHWRKEVWADLHEVAYVKKTHKFPSDKFIYRNTWLDNKHHIRTTVEEVLYKESNITPDRWRLDQIEVLEDLMNDYFDWLSLMLSKYGEVSSIDVYNKLEELGL